MSRNVDNRLERLRTRYNSTVFLFREAALGMVPETVEYDDTYARDRAMVLHHRMKWMESIRERYFRQAG